MTRRLPRLYRQGASVTLQEIQDVLADEGYSSGSRKTWLKSTLTELTAGTGKIPSPEEAQLMEQIASIIDRQVEGEPIAVSDRKGAESKDNKTRRRIQKGPRRAR